MPRASRPTRGAPPSGKPPLVTRRRLLVCIALLLVAAGLRLSLWPLAAEPLAWTPSPSPPLPADSPALANAERLFEGRIEGPEALYPLEDGRLLSGLEDGRVVVLDPGRDKLVTLAATQGRPLAVHPGGEDGLLLADAQDGLLRLARGHTQTLSRAQGGRPYRLVNHLAIGRDRRTLWFSDASWRFGRDALRQEIFASRPHGRLLAYDLEEGAVSLLLDGLHFPNGIAAGPDDAYLLIVETTRYRVLRHWLQGERAGETEVFIDNLPGFPDNITFNGEDRFWLALASPRSELLDWLMPRPGLRRLLMRLPAGLQPEAPAVAHLLALDTDGRVIAELRDAGPGAYAPVTTALEAGDWLYLGSVRQPALARLPLEAVLP